MSVRREDPDPREAALAEVQAEADALDPKNLELFTVDVQYAVGMVLQKQPLLETLRPQMAQLTFFEIASLDMIGTQARALDCANARCLALSTSPTALATLRDEATTLRDSLELDARGLANHGLLEPGVLGELKKSTSDHCTVSDLKALCAAFRADPAKLEGKTAVTEQTLAHASKLADQLLSAVSERLEPHTAITLALAQNRRRVFTLFKRSWSQLQRAVTFLRWDEDDVDHYAPSLYQGSHATKSNSAEPAPAAPVAPSAPSAPSAKPAPVNSALEAARALSTGGPVPQGDPFKR